MLEQVRSLLSNTPFRPFEIHCSSGEVFQVEHSENAAVVGNFVVVALSGGKKAIMISPLHITGVSGIQSVPA
jgi:hypothetical protein